MRHLTEAHPQVLIIALRIERHPAVDTTTKAALADNYSNLNPAAIQRQIQALTTKLLTITTSKAGPAKKATPTHVSTDDSTDHTTRAS